MLKVGAIRVSRGLLPKALCRWESSNMDAETLKEIRNTQWPILKGAATEEQTKWMKSRYMKKRIVNTVPK
jgi:hypothetical protein